MSSLLQQLKEKESTQLTLYKESLDQLATQRESKTKAWMEVATTQTLDGLAEKLTTFRTEQQAHIDDFFNVQQQNLQQDLDEFQYHAQETLHAGIFGPDHPNPRARNAPPPSRAIPEETDDPQPPVAEDNGAPASRERQDMPTLRDRQDMRDQQDMPTGTRPTPQDIPDATPQRPTRWKKWTRKRYASGGGTTEPARRSISRPPCWDTIDPLQ